MKYLLRATLPLIGILMPAIASAQILPPCWQDGNCQTCDLIQLLVNWSTGVLYFLGTFAVIFFIVGGIFWIVAAGNPERIAKGRLLMVSSVIGIVLAMLSYNIVNLIIYAAVPVTGQKISGLRKLDTVEIFTGSSKWKKHWAEYCTHNDRLDPTSTQVE